MKTVSAILSSILAASCLLTPSSAWYMPGVAPRAFTKGETLEVWANKVYSSRTQLSFAYNNVPVCKFSGGDAVEGDENIGQALAGDRVQLTPYPLKMLEPAACQMLCQLPMSEQTADELSELIEEDYMVDLVMDNMPAVVRNIDATTLEEVSLQRGYYMGTRVLLPDGKPGQILNNHLEITVHVHEPEVDSEFADQAKTDQPQYQVVGFEVVPMSIEHPVQGEAKPGMKLPACEAVRAGKSAAQLVVSPSATVVYSYSLQFVASDTPWAHRWDVFLSNVSSPGVHWFAVLNSLGVAVLLSSAVAMILVRALFRDIEDYNSANLDADIEESGWKLVHGDVFRVPGGFFGPMFLSVWTASGIQIADMLAVTMLFAVMGFLSPAHRGSLASSLLVLFFLSGAHAGYTAARLYKFLGGKGWKRNTTLTALSFPGVVVSVFMIVNMAAWAEGSSNAIPFKYMVLVVTLWFGVSMPLVFGGAYYGYKAKDIQPPVKPRQIARAIPPQPWFKRSEVIIPAAGVLPFMAVLIELFFIMESIWLNEVYYMFTVLALVLAILVVTAAEVSIVVTYFTLLSENWNWWWRAFLAPGASGAYVALYAVYYGYAALSLDGTLAVVMYVGYMFTAAWAFFLFTGAVGFLSALVFNMKIFAAIKVD